MDSPRMIGTSCSEYRLDGDAIESGVLMSDGPDEKFFLAMVQPPAAVPVATIVPREYVFIVDVSGSMHGFPLDTTRALLSELLPSLRPSDTFNLLLFRRRQPCARAAVDSGERAELAACARHPRA
jgi:hypothetical protein